MLLYNWVENKLIADVKVLSSLYSPFVSEDLYCLSERNKSHNFFVKEVLFLLFLICFVRSLFLAAV